MLTDGHLPRPLGGAVPSAVVLKIKGCSYLMLRQSPKSHLQPVTSPREARGPHAPASVEPFQGDFICL